MENVVNIQMIDDRRIPAIVLVDEKELDEVVPYVFLLLLTIFTTI